MSSTFFEHDGPSSGRRPVSTRVCSNILLYLAKLLILMM